jgi:hypothetical protein
MQLDEYIELGEPGRAALLDVALDAARQAEDQIADVLILKARYNAWRHLPEVIEIEFDSDPDIPDLLITAMRLADGSQLDVDEVSPLGELINNEVEELLREAQSHAGNRRFEPYSDVPRIFRIVMPGVGVGN